MVQLWYLALVPGVQCPGPIRGVALGSISKIWGLRHSPALHLVSGAWDLVESSWVWLCLQGPCLGPRSSSGPRVLCLESGIRGPWFSVKPLAYVVLHPTSCGLGSTLASRFQGPESGLSYPVSFNQWSLALVQHQQDPQVGVQ